MISYTEVDSLSEPPSRRVKRRKTSNPHIGLATSGAPLVKRKLVKRMAKGSAKNRKRREGWSGLYNLASPTG